jgi:hypothetical protein
VSWPGSGASSGKTIFQEGIFFRGIADSRSLGFSIHPSGAELDSQQLVLCSLGAEVREAGTARRFRFLNWNFHAF